MDYETARELAGTWGLVLLFAAFVLIVIWVFRPGSKKKYERDAEIPLKHNEDR